MNDLRSAHSDCFDVRQFSDTREYKSDLKSNYPQQVLIWQYVLSAVDEALLASHGRAQKLFNANIRVALQIVFSQVRNSCSHV